MCITGIRTHARKSEYTLYCEYTHLSQHDNMTSLQMNCIWEEGLRALDCVHDA
jgi:hypothetical protein